MRTFKIWSFFKCFQGCQLAALKAIALNMFQMILSISFNTANHEFVIYSVGGIAIDRHDVLRFTAGRNLDGFARIETDGHSGRGHCHPWDAGFIFRSEPRSYP